MARSAPARRGDRRIAALSKSRVSPADCRQMLSDGLLAPVFGLLVEKGKAAILAGSQWHPHLKQGGRDSFPVAKCVVDLGCRYARGIAIRTTNDVPWTVGVVVACHPSTHCSESFSQ
jgi:hypothetical protein